MHGRPRHVARTSTLLLMPYDSDELGIVAAFIKPTTGCVMQAGEGKAFVLGLTGMGGIGKTTLANALYNHLLPGFSEAYCFLDSVSHCAANPRGIVELQTNMLRKLCGLQCTTPISNEDDGTEDMTVPCLHVLDVLTSLSYMQCTLRHQHWCGGA